jgi:hypothetical protein
MPRYVLMVFGEVIYAGDDLPPTLGLINWALYEHIDGAYCLIGCDCPPQ